MRLCDGIVEDAGHAAQQARSVGHENLHPADGFRHAGGSLLPLQQDRQAGDVLGHLQHEIDGLEQFLLDAGNLDGVERLGHVRDVGIRLEQPHLPRCDDPASIRRDDRAATKDDLRAAGQAGVLHHRTHRGVQDGLAGANLTGNADTPRTTGSALPAHEVVGEFPGTQGGQVRLDGGIVDDGDDRSHTTLDVTAIAPHGDHILDRQEPVVVPDVVVLGHLVRRFVGRLDQGSGRVLLRSLPENFLDGRRDVPRGGDQFAHLLLGQVVVLDEILTVVDVVSARWIGEGVPDRDALRFRHDLFDHDQLVAIHLPRDTHGWDRAAHDAGAQAGRVINQATQFPAVATLLQGVVDPAFGAARGDPQLVFDRFLDLLLLDLLRCSRHPVLINHRCLARRGTHFLWNRRPAHLLATHDREGDRAGNDREGPVIDRTQYLNDLGCSSLDVGAGDVQENLGLEVVLGLREQR